MEKHMKQVTSAKETHLIKVHHTNGTTIEKIQQKYKDRDIIQIRYNDIRKALMWTVGTDYIPRPLVWNNMYLNPIRTAINRNNGFIAFVQKGVLANYIEQQDGINYYPYEFKDDHMYLSLVVTDADDGQMKTCMKLRFDKLLKMEILEENSILCKGNYHSFLIDPQLESIRNKGHETQSEYFRQIAYMQLVMILAVNMYLVLHEKDVLVSRITQTRELKAGTKKKHGPVERSLFYRYRVEIPENYKPRKFETANYTASEWNRAGHVSHVWVLWENARIIAKRRGGTVLWDTRKKGKVKVEYIRKPTVAHRRIGKDVPEGSIGKIYK